MEKEKKGKGKEGTKLVLMVGNKGKGVNGVNG